MFVFYFAVMSALTPPVCTGAYTAAGLAGANPNKVGFTSLRLALGGFVVPLIFISHPSILLVEGYSIVNLVYIVSAIAVGLILIAAAFEGYMLEPITMFWRFVFFATAVLLVVPSIPAAACGWAMAITITFLHWKGSRNNAAEPAQQNH